MSKQYLLGEVKAAKGDDGSGVGEFEVVLSAPTLDRDGEIVDAKIFEPLPDHITFDIDHGMSVATTVGSGVPRYDDDGRLLVKGTYSSIPRAQEVRTLVREGHIRTTSVAFMNPTREEKDGVPHVVSAELLNGAFVGIPSNRESVVLSSKAYEEATAVKVGARNSTGDGARLQSIHDLSVENGAACETKGLPRRDTAVAVKGHGMTANDLREAVTKAVRTAHGHDPNGDRYVWVRDYTDEWAVFEIWTDDAVSAKGGLYQQDYTVDGRVAQMTGDPAEVMARTVYEPVPADAGTATRNVDSSPRTATPVVAKSSASAVARARIAIARASLPTL